MHYLKGTEEQHALDYLTRAAFIAQSATCERSRCGSIIVARNEIIGIGFNSPARDLDGLRRCRVEKSTYHSKVTDKTCCVHAEQRAIMDALRRNPENIEGSRLYFMRLDAEWKPTRAGDPYCTICSKMSLDVGIDEFVLWQEQGVAVFKMDEYHLLSCEFGKKG